jgi:hypothetical protein
MIADKQHLRAILLPEVCNLPIGRVGLSISALQISALVSKEFLALLVPLLVLYF